MLPERPSRPSATASTTRPPPAADHGTAGRTRPPTHRSQCPPACSGSCRSDRRPVHGVVQLLPQESHAAPGVARYSTHRALLDFAGLGHPRGTARRRRPRARSVRHPPVPFGHRTVDIAHLQHHLESGSSQVDQPLGSNAGGPTSVDPPPEPLFQRGPDIGFGQSTANRNSSRCRHHRGRAAAPPRPPPDGATGAAHLLVVRDRRWRCAQVHNERQIGLVEAHAERRGGHHARQRAVVECCFDALALGWRGWRPCRTPRRYPPLPGTPTGAFCFGHGQAIDQPWPLMAPHPAGEPGQLGSAPSDAGQPTGAAKAGPASRGRSGCRGRAGPRRRPSHGRWRWRSSRGPGCPG